MCLGQETPNVREIRTVEVLIFNPNGPKFPSRVCVDLSHIEQQQREVGGGLRTAGSDKHNQPQPYSAYGCVTHARCMGGSVITLCSVHDVCCLRGTCLVCVLMGA